MEISSAVGWKRCSRLMALFKGCGLRQTQSFLFGFSTTSSLPQLVGFWIGSMISTSTICFNYFSNFGFKARGIFLADVTIRGYIILDFIMVSIFEFLFIHNNQKTQTKIVHHLHLWQKHILSGLDFHWLIILA